MLLGGDEFGRTQGGNNNAYCQDNAISWFDWTLRPAPRPGPERLHRAPHRAAQGPSPAAGWRLPLWPGGGRARRAGHRMVRRARRAPLARRLAKPRGPGLADAPGPASAGGELELVALALNGAAETLSFASALRGTGVRAPDRQRRSAGRARTGRRTLELPGGAAVLLRGVGSRRHDPAFGPAWLGDGRVRFAALGARMRAGWLELDERSRPPPMTSLGDGWFSLETGRSRARATAFASRPTWPSLTRPPAPRTATSTAGAYWSAPDTYPGP
jgi:hypothetical protein